MNDINSTSEWSAATALKASEGQMSCDLAGEAAILNLTTGIYYGLDPVGARAWELMQTPTTLGAVCDELLQEYEVEAEILENDLKVLLDDMLKHGLVVRG